ncbi:MAG: hypothetical protein NC102_04745 [Clostridium sp.]|nr:hypothetical protein [Clostridium sp.]
MKKTSYIIIALAILPLAMVFLSPFIISLYADDDSTRRQMGIDISKSLTEISAPAFNKAKIEIKDLGSTPDVCVVARKGEANRILVADNVASMLSFNAEGQTLKISIAVEDGDFHYLRGDTLMIIEAPSLEALSLNDLNILKLVGFSGQDIAIKFDQDIYMRDCQFDSADLVDAGKLCLTNSRVGHARVEAESYFKTFTDDSRIDSMTVTTSSRRLYFTYTDANIGILQILPEGKEAVIKLNGQITINNDSHASND